MAQAEVVVLNGPVIQAGESLSDSIDCSAGRISRITMPPEWDAADISFEVSTDGMEPFFNPLYWGDGDQYVIKAGAGRSIIINQQGWIPGFWIKIRSGTYGVNVTQTKQRQFAVALVVGSKTEEEPASQSNFRK